MATCGGDKNLHWIRFCPLFAALLMLSAGAWADPQRIRELAASDPAAAVVMGLSLWQVGDDRSPELGLALVSALVASGSHGEAEVVVDELEPLVVAISQRAQLLSAKMDIAGELNRSDADAGLRQQSTLLMTQLSPVQQAGLNQSMGLLSYRRGDFEAAAEQLRLAIDKRAGITDATQASLYRRLGASLSQLGRFPSAIESYQSGLKISDSLENHSPIDILRNLAGTLIYLGEYEQAIGYSQRALALAAPNSESARVIESNLGVAYQQMGDLAQAQGHYQRALAVAEHLGTPQPALMNNLAYLQFELGNYRESLDLLDRAVAIYEKEGRIELALARKNQGENWMALGNHERAIDYFSQAYDLFMVHDMKPKRLELYPVMIQSLEKAGDFRRALELHKEFKELGDELNSADSAKQVAGLQAEIALERSQKDLVEARQLSEISEAKVDRLERQRAGERQTQWLLTAALALVSIFTIYLIQNIRFRAQANRDLGERNAEIQRQHERLQTLSDRVKQQSREDELTGLFNRRYLREFLDKELPRIQRAAGSDAAAPQLVILIDLDHFKEVNDQHGHAAGDLVLRSFAAALTGCARKDDICVRWGGEEFLWLCRNASEKDAQQLCERLMQAVAASPVVLDGQSIGVQCSIGVARFPLTDGGVLDWDLCIKAADEALYAAKANGRNQWVMAN